MGENDTRPEGAILNASIELPKGYQLPKAHGHQATFSSVRKAIHKGHRISIRTTYRIEIDGAPLTQHTSVADDGTVRCHGLPNYSFSSAVDLARAIVESSKLAYTPRDDFASDGHEGGEGQ